MHRQLTTSAVDRPRLLARLEAGASGALTLVLGPSGVGKSILLRQWAAAGPEPAPPWVRIDATLADAVSFGRRLVAAIAERHEGFGADALHHLELGGGRLGVPYLEALRAALVGLPHTVVVLEDLHALPHPIVEELGWLVARWPPPLHLVVASRLPPPWSLSRLRADGQLTEVLAPELAFTHAETAEVAHRIAGAPLAPTELDLVHERTEGWPVGVHLAALAVRGGGEVGTVLSSRGSAVRPVAQYLTEEVLSQQPPEVAAFLLRTCVLDHLHPDLCDELTGDRHGHRLLDELEWRNLFLVAADDRPGWYRYHPLFADVLRHRLRVEDPDAFAEALGRAALWHLHRDDLEPAVEYLLRAERWEEALDTIAADGWTLYSRGEATTAIRWLESVPSSILRAHHHADSTLIFLHRVTGNAAIADRLLEERHRTVAPASRKDMGRHVYSAMGILWGRDPADCLAHAEAALAWLDDPPPGTGPAHDQPNDDDARVGARLPGARALHLLERWDEARAWLDAAVATTTADPAMHVRALAALAHLDADLGHLERSDALARRSLRLADQVDGNDPSPLSEAHLALGTATYERDQLDEAAAHLREAEELARLNRCTVLVALAVAGRAQVDRARGQARQGRDRIAAWRAAGDGPVPRAVEARLGAAEARCLIAVGQSPRARRTLARAPRGAETLAVAALMAASADDARLLRTVLDRWPDALTARGRIEHALWQSWLVARQGDADAAVMGVLGAARLADVDGLRRPFLDGGPCIAELVATVAAGTADQDVPGASALRHLHQEVVAAAATTTATSSLLSVREVEVLAHLATLATTVEIARQLEVSPNTLKTHVKRIYRKLGAANRREAVAAGSQLGLIDAPHTPHAPVRRRAAARPASTGVTRTER